MYWQNVKVGHRSNSHFLSPSYEYREPSELLAFSIKLEKTTVLRKKTGFQVQTSHLKAQAESLQSLTQWHLNLTLF